MVFTLLHVGAVQVNRGKPGTGTAALEAPGLFQLYRCKMKVPLSFPAN